jgi:dienelactone hydrolase
VTTLRRYLAEEIATDHAAGLLTRREALRRLALLGLGAAAAGELISACSPAHPAEAPAPPPAAESSTGTSQPPGAAKAALDRTGLVNEIVVEPDANHAFFNDTGPRYNAAAAADAWRRLLDWFGRYLAPQ